MLTLKTNLAKYKDAWILLFALFFIVVFFTLEGRTEITYNIISSSLDNYIPFCEYFVVPYFLWFPYMLFPILYLYFKSKRDYNKLVISGAIGMTIFLFISYIYPNTLIIRPDTFANDNVFSRLISFLHSIDTCTNVFPSIHVYNSLAVHVALLKCSNLKNILWAKILSWVLSISIILSTVFIKQHSIVDVIGAFALYLIIHVMIYNILPAFFTPQYKA